LTGADKGRDGISPQGFDKISFKEPLYVSMHIVTLYYIIHTSAKAVVSRKKMESSNAREGGITRQTSVFAFQPAEYINPVPRPLDPFRGD